MVVQKSIRSLISTVLLLGWTQLLAQNPPDISLVFYLDENSENGTLIGAVMATDPDGDALTYSIVSGDGENAFAIVSSGSNAGNITVNDELQLDYESNPSFALIVEADDGSGGMTIASVTVNLNDIDEDVLGTRRGDVPVFVYPNPVDDVLTINIGGIQIDAVKIHLYTLGGSQVPIVHEMVSNSEIALNAAALRSGIYLLRVGDQEISRTIRINKK